MDHVLRKQVWLGKWHSVGNHSTVKFSTAVHKVPATFSQDGSHTDQKRDPGRWGIEKKLMRDGSVSKIFALKV